MLIAADIGNTNIVIGFFKDGNFLFSRRLHTGPPQSVDEYEMLLRGMLFAFNGDLDTAESGVVASVVPELTGVFIELLKRITGQKTPDRRSRAQARHPDRNGFSGESRP